MNRIEAIYTDEGIVAKLDNGDEYFWTFEELSDSVIECICTKCLNPLTAEPDADSAYCENCNKVTKIFNPALLVLGAIF